MIVMPANSTGWWTHIMARETGRLGHLYSPGAQRSPKPWLPYALDNGAFACWDPDDNTFDAAKWEGVERAWHRLIVWAQCQNQKPMWTVVPDVPGNAEATAHCWYQYAPALTHFPRALAVQDGMTAETVRRLAPAPDVIAVGGSTEWKWATVAMWAAEFPRVHLLRCNSPKRLYELEALGVESCDGTGWGRGNRTQHEGLETWARQPDRIKPHTAPIADHMCRDSKDKNQGSFI